MDGIDDVVKEIDRRTTRWLAGQASPAPWRWSNSNGRALVQGKSDEGGACVAWTENGSPDVLTASYVYRQMLPVVDDEAEALLDRLEGASALAASPEAEKQEAAAGGAESQWDLLR